MPVQLVTPDIARKWAEAARREAEAIDVKEADVLCGKAHTARINAQRASENLSKVRAEIGATVSEAVGVPVAGRELVARRIKEERSKAAVLAQFPDQARAASEVLERARAFAAKRILLRDSQAPRAEIDAAEAEAKAAYAEADRLKGDLIRLREAALIAASAASESIPTEVLELDKAEELIEQSRATVEGLQRAMDLQRTIVAAMQEGQDAQELEGLNLGISGRSIDQATEALQSIADQLEAAEQRQAETEEKRDDAARALQERLDRGALSIDPEAARQMSEALKVAESEAERRETDARRKGRQCDNQRRLQTIKANTARVSRLLDLVAGQMDARGEERRTVELTEGEAEALANVRIATFAPEPGEPALPAEITPPPGRFEVEPFPRPPRVPGVAFKETITPDLRRVFAARRDLSEQREFPEAPDFCCHNGLADRPDTLGLMDKAIKTAYTWRKIDRFSFFNEDYQLMNFTEGGNLLPRNVLSLGLISPIPRGAKGVFSTFKDSADPEVPTASDMLWMIFNRGLCYCKGSQHEGQEEISRRVSCYLPPQRFTTEVFLSGRREKVLGMQLAETDFLEMLSDLKELPVEMVRKYVKPSELRVTVTMKTKEGKEIKKTRTAEIESVGRLIKERISREDKMKLSMLRDGLVDWYDRAPTWSTFFVPCVKTISTESTFAAKTPPETLADLAAARAAKKEG